MANMLTRPIANAAQRIAASTYLWGHTGTGPAVDLRFAATDIVMKDGSGNYSLGTASAPAFGSRLRVEGGIESHSAQFNVVSGASVQFEFVNRSATAGFDWYVNSGTALAARLDGTGKFILGRTTAISSAIATVQQSGGAGSPALALNHTAASGTRFMSAFYISATEVGSITSNGTTTTYNTSSDYRLKDEIVDLEGSGEFIDALRPREWIWKKDGNPGTGFIAHEFAEVSPSSVSGVKDEMQTEVAVDLVTGKEVKTFREKHQSMQASSAEVMAHIIAELQSLRARLAALESPAT